MRPMTMKAMSTMTLDELEQEARAHGLHVWMSHTAGGGPGLLAAVVPTAIGSDIRQTILADTPDQMRAKLAENGLLARHADSPAARQAREDTAMPYIGRRRKQ